MPDRCHAKNLLIREIGTENKASHGDWQAIAVTVRIAEIQREYLSSEVSCRRCHWDGRANFKKRSCCEVGSLEPLKPAFLEDPLTVQWGASVGFGGSCDLTRDQREMGGLSGIGVGEVDSGMCSPTFLSSRRSKYHESCNKQHVLQLPSLSRVEFTSADVPVPEFNAVQGGFQSGRVSFNANTAPHFTVERIEQIIKVQVGIGRG